MIKKTLLSIIICIFINLSCIGQHNDWETHCFHNCKNSLKFKIGDTLCSKCYADGMKYSFDSVICSTLDSLAVFLKQDSNIALVIMGTEGVSQDFYNKNRNTSSNYEWQNRTFKYANFAKRYLQYRKQVSNKIACYGIGYKPYTPWPKEWWKQICYSFLQIVITTKDSIHSFQLSKNQAFELKNIYFETNQWVLHKGNDNKLDLLANYMIDNPYIKIEISGHTDNIGSVENNLVLSEKRANAVKEYLIEREIDKNRILAKGYGSSKPKSGNDTEDERTKNRRVEVIIK